MRTDYSTKELEMIEILGFTRFLDSESLTPVAVYRLMAEQAFIKDLKGPAVDSLRRCFKALNTCKPYRMTKEFDDLINFQ